MRHYREDKRSTRRRRWGYWMLLGLAVVFCERSLLECHAFVLVPLHNARSSTVTAQGRRLSMSLSASNSTTLSSSNDTSTAIDVTSLQAQAERLRKEADSLRDELTLQQRRKQQAQEAKVDAWIENLFFVYLKQQTCDKNDSSSTHSNDVEVLHSVDQVMESLRDQRFSQEQVTKIFNRICEQSPQSRSQCSPLMETLVDAVGLLDCVDRDMNANKR